MTLVVAPPGYGKTVAVELWLAERRAGLRAGCAPTRATTTRCRLWSSVATAVERVRPGAGTDALAKLREPFGVVLPAIDALAIGLAADERPIVLVIDDVQSIGDGRCLRSLDHAVASLPEHVQLVLISRTVPAMRLARLRTEGELVEVGAARAGVLGGRGAATVRGGARRLGGRGDRRSADRAHGGMGRGALSRCALAA